VDGGPDRAQAPTGSRAAPSHTPVAVLRFPVVRKEIEARGGIYAYLWLERKVAAPARAGAGAHGSEWRGQRLKASAGRPEEGRRTLGYRLEQRQRHRSPPLGM
jgi:hypothetical protein